MDPMICLVLLLVAVVFAALWLCLRYDVHRATAPLDPQALKFAFDRFDELKCPDKGLITLESLRAARDNSSNRQQRKHLAYLMVRLDRIGHVIDEVETVIPVFSDVPMALPATEYVWGVSREDLTKACSNA